MIQSTKSWKEFDELKNIDQKYYCSNHYDVNVNKYGVKCGTSLDLGKMINVLVLLILMVGFSGILGIFYVEDLKMMKDKLKNGNGL